MEDNIVVLPIKNKPPFRAIRLDVAFHKHIEDGQEKIWHIVTCEQEPGLFLADPCLKTCLSQVTEAMMLLEKARNEAHDPNR